MQTLRHKILASGIMISAVIWYFDAYHSDLLHDKRSEKLIIANDTITKEPLNSDGWVIYNPDIINRFYEKSAGLLSSRYTAGVPDFETADRPAAGNWTAVASLAAMAPQDFQSVTKAAGDMAVIWDVGSFVSSDTVYVSDLSLAEHGAHHISLRLRVTVRAAQESALMLQVI